MAARKPSFARHAAALHRSRAPPRGRERRLRRARDEGCGHTASRRPAGVDGQHRLHEVLVERGTSEQAAAALAISAPSSHSAAIAKRAASGREPAASKFLDLREKFAGENPSQRNTMLSGPLWASSIVPHCLPIRSRRPSLPVSGSQDHGARCAQPWLATVSPRSIGQDRGRIASPGLTRPATPAIAVQAASSACRRSARISSSCSMPIDSRT